jgi:NAD(P)-dependent dehydrogenase (short-subunit alcohol dehydrogenase family)
MSSKVWLVTGSGRGLGGEIVEAALAAGDRQCRCAINGTVARSYTVVAAGDGACGRGGMKFTSCLLRPRAALVARVAALLFLVGAWVFAADEAEAPFLNENAAAMSKMMAAMAVRPSGDVDRDFVATMVPHHQGAIEMAQAQLRYGHNEQLRRLAQEIIVEQTQEIAAMRLAVEDLKQ